MMATMSWVDLWVVGMALLGGYVAGVVTCAATIDRERYRAAQGKHAPGAHPEPSTVHVRQLPYDWEQEQ